MPAKRMQMPKLPELEDEKLTPYQRFRILAKKVVAVPKEAVDTKAKKNKPQASGS